MLNFNITIMETIINKTEIPTSEFFKSDFSEDFNGEYFREDFKYILAGKSSFTEMVVNVPINGTKEDHFITVYAEENDGERTIIIVDNGKMELSDGTPIMQLRHGDLLKHVKNESNWFFVDTVRRDYIGGFGKTIPAGSVKYWKFVRHDAI